MDLAAVKAAGRLELSECAYAAARNVLGLLQDAELLDAAGSRGRAYTLAALAVEECGKAICLVALAILPESLRMQAPVGRMLEWHQLKQVGGLLVVAVPIDPPGLAAKLAAMPAAQATQIVSTLSAPGEEADRLRRRGMYVDMGRTGEICEPSDITEAELDSQLVRARLAAASAALLLGPVVQARIADPPAEVIELACALVKVVIEAGNSRTSEAAADIMLNAVSVLQDNMAIKDAALGEGA